MAGAQSETLANFVEYICSSVPSHLPEEHMAKLTVDQYLAAAAARLAHLTQTYAIVFSPVSRLCSRYWRTHHQRD